MSGSIGPIAESPRRKASFVDNSDAYSGSCAVGTDSDDHEQAWAWKTYSSLRGPMYSLVYLFEGPFIILHGTLLEVSIQAYTVL